MAPVTEPPRASAFFNRVSDMQMGFFMPAILHFALIGKRCSDAPISSILNLDN